jgi:predicted ferric reductase
VANSCAKCSSAIPCVGAAWVVIYLLFILGPLFALLAGRLPPPRDFFTEFSAAIGYAGLAMMGLQFGLTARFRYVTEPWGEDVVYHFHRAISLVAVALVIAHPLILFVVRPQLLALLNFFVAPWRARFAGLSTYSPIALVVMALWRVGLNIRYETWHFTHIALAVIAVAAGLLHMIAWGFYLAAPWKRSLWIGLSSHRKAPVHASSAVPCNRSAP